MIYMHNNLTKYSLLSRVSQPGTADILDWIILCCGGEHHIYYKMIKSISGNLPRGPVVKNSPCNARWTQV